VLGFLILAAKNSRKRMPALSPAAAISAGSGRCVVVILRGGVNWVTTREPLEVVNYPDLTSDRVAEQLGGCVAQAALEQDKKHSVGNPGRPVRQRTLPSDRRTSARQ
jgi:N-methylhydantoinase B/oxoprolinase/acetone carboxylase alpha subunit